MPIRKMHPVEENDNVGLESFYVHILSLASEARSLNLFHHVANPLVTAMFVDRFPLNEIRDVRIGTSRRSSCLSEKCTRLKKMTMWA